MLDETPASDHVRSTLLTPGLAITEVGVAGQETVVGGRDARDDGEGLSLGEPDGAAEALGDALIGIDPEGEGDADPEGDASTVGAGDGNDVDPSAGTTSGSMPVLIGGDASGDGFSELVGAAPIAVVAMGDAELDSEALGEELVLVLTEAEGVGLALLDGDGGGVAEGRGDEGSQIARCRGSPGMPEDIALWPGAAAAMSALKDATTRPPAARTRAHREELHGRICTTVSMRVPSVWGDVRLSQPHLIFGYLARPVSLMGSPLRVLVIEDDAFLRGLLVEMLEGRGFFAAV